MRAQQSRASRRAISEETPAPWDRRTPSHLCRLKHCGCRPHRPLQPSPRCAVWEDNSRCCFAVGQWVLSGRQNSVRRGRKPMEKTKIDQTLRSGSFEFDLCQKSPGSSPKRTNSIPASHDQSKNRAMNKARCTGIGKQLGFTHGNLPRNDGECAPEARAGSASRGRHVDTCALWRTRSMQFRI